MNLYKQFFVMITSQCYQSSLKNIVCEKIRKNWDTYKNYETFKNIHFYNNLWKTWVNKYRYFVINYMKYYKLLKKFIENEEIIPNRNYRKVANNLLVIKNLYFKTDTILGRQKEKDEIMFLFQYLGLHYYTKIYKNESEGIVKKTLHICKPKDWKWEFSSQNIHFEREQKIKMVENNHNNFIVNKLKENTCFICSNNGYDVDLFVSMNLMHLYCFDCINKEDLILESVHISNYNFSPLYLNLFKNCIIEYNGE